MADPTGGAMAPIAAFALVGAIGVGSQWAAWRMRMPAIVLMLAAGLIIGPATGLFDPERDIGPLYRPMISLAVAVILFEGGMTLNFHTLADAASGVRRLVLIGAPLGWLTSALAVHYGAGLSWESSAVFGGIMIVTGPTVIAPLLRQARLKKRPAMLLQWEAIVNDPIGALAAVFAFEVVVILRAATTAGEALLDFAMGTAWAIALGIAAGWGLANVFRRHWIPEYMKVPVLFATLLGVFAASDLVMHESGLLAVTIMGIVIGNSNLPSYTELRRFKEHATVLLVSGVFILLAASLDMSALKTFDARTVLFVLSVMLLARPVTVLLSLIGSGVPWKEKLLVAVTGPRGVVLVAVAGLFGDRLVELGVEDAAAIGPLAFALVAATVVFHGFTLVPVARFLDAAGGETPGVLLVGGSRFTRGLAEALQKAEIPALLSDTNRYRLRAAREAGIPTWYGDILGEASENGVEFMTYGTVIAATDNDAYNTLVATDLTPEFGRENVLQVARAKEGAARHSLPSTLGGRTFGARSTWDELESMMRDGWTIRSTRLTEEFGLAEWREKNPEAVLLARLADGELKFLKADDEPKSNPGVRLFAMVPPAPADEAA